MSEESQRIAYIRTILGEGGEAMLAQVAAGMGLDGAKSVVATAIAAVARKPEPIPLEPNKLISAISAEIAGQANQVNTPEGFRGC